MFRIRAAVVETEDNFQVVFVDSGEDPVLYKAIGGVDVEATLRATLGYVYGDCDWVYECCWECGGWHVFDVEVIDDVEW